MVGPELEEKIPTDKIKGWAQGSVIPLTSHHHVANINSPKLVKLTFLPQNSFKKQRNLQCVWELLALAIVEVQYKLFPQP